MAGDRLAGIGYGDAPAVLLCADGPAAMDRLRGFAERSGCRIAAAEPVAMADRLVDRFAGADPILVELDGRGDAHGDAAAAFLRRVHDEAESRGRRAVVVVAPALIDLAAARAWHPDIELQCEPDPAERVAAIVAATRPPPLRLRDVGRESNALLQQLSEEVGRIAHILASMSSDEAESGSGQGRLLAEAEEDSPPIPSSFVRSMIRARRLREQYFRPDLFADPAWDMLLDLMAARLEGNRVAVSSLCIAAAVPATTALRWIKALTDRGVFVRSADPEDGRRVYIELSDDSARSLAAYLRTVQRLSHIAV